ncbi:putative DNA polymerase [Frankliniella fusca]|uniref:DNA-directed DNA polymerase n=1 Tax=Frankliniella fusca TaxID=407009 RepID=A0AAE1H6X7_9NEOP|nr:putative DNA polymerase [Frankliniella fusca]
MAIIREIVNCWQNGLYVAEQWKAEAFIQLLDCIEREDIPRDRALLDILAEGYRAYRAQIVYLEIEDPTVDREYRHACERVTEVLNADPAVVQEGEGRDAPAGAAQERGEDADAAGPVIELVASTERYLARFRTSFRQETFHVSNLRDRLLRNEEYMTTLFDQLLQRQIQVLNAKEDDRCVLELRGNDENRPIYFHLRPVNQLNGRVILDKLVRTLNSNEEFMGGVFHLNFIHIPRLAGGARDDRCFIDVQTWINNYCKTGSMYDPKNINDRMCLARCIVYLQLYSSTENRNLRKKLKNPNNVEISRLARELCDISHVDKNTVSGYDDIVRMQENVKERLVVFLDRKCEETYFVGSRRNDQGEVRSKTLFLYLKNDHYYGVVRMTAVTGFRYFCEDCVKGYWTANQHRCTFSCDRCDGDVLHTEKQLKECKVCWRFFAGNECFASHLIKRGNKSVCDIKKYCKRCEKFYHLDGKTKVKKHECGRSICNYCNEYVPDNHKCYMTPWEPKRLAKNTRYMRMYFDIETRQNDSFETRDNWKEHKANLLISQQVCEVCENDDDMKNVCENCGIREHIFEGFDNETNVVSEFINYLQSLCSEKKTHITVFGHNFKSFDGYFIIQELLQRNITPKIKLSGAKILSLETNALHFKDSIMFLPQKLSSLPKAFGLNELKKGYFCHLANNEAYYDYEGPIPPKETYCCSTLSDSELNAFNKWYDDQVRSNYRFNFRNEIISYCQSDVNILRQAMESFRTLFMETAQFDPLMHCITLSAACMCNFRMNHLGNGALGIVPRGGYRGRDMQSYEALMWLQYESHVIGAVIQHAENSREYKVLGHAVDGYVELGRPDGSIEKRIYQYHGCYYHLCKRCIPDEASRSKIRGRSKEDPYEKTVFLTRKFRNAGYTVIEKWGCEFHSDLKNNVNVIQYFQQNPYKRQKPLNLRDAICGGRTSALYAEYVAKLDEGEVIKFFDIISEYPAVQYHKWYPEGHPKIYLEGDPEMPKVKDMNGVILTTVLAPKDLFLPVLPYKCCNKLMFPLCRKCVESMNQGVCSHTDSERELTGTWCAPEVQLAVEKGYQIMKVHEVYQYPNVRVYNKQTKTDGLFTSYVRQNMAMKIEATGWPSHVNTDEEKEAYVQKHLLKDGIILDKTKFERNPGKRTLAKLILNSFWGKLGERTLRSQTTFVKSYAALAKLAEDATITVSSIIPYGDDVLQVCYTPHKDMEDSMPTTSLVHAAFTTCHGRMMLYEYLSVVDQRALYHDTDSICFISKPGHPEPPLGEYLGCLSDQLKDDYGPGSVATHFLAAGAKNYGYKVAVGGSLNNIKTIVKIRGISINSSCSDTVNFENLRSMIRGESERTVVNIPAQIARVSKWRIVTRPSSKIWRVCLTKRRRLERLTVPYGFDGQILDDDDYDCLLALGDLAEQN